MQFNHPPLAGADANILTTNKSIYLKAFDIGVFIYEHCYEHIDIDTNIKKYELLYQHLDNDIKLNKDTIIKGNYYLLKLNPANDKPVDKDGGVLEGTFTFPYLSSFNNEVKKIHSGNDNIETLMKKAINSIYEKYSADKDNLTAILKFTDNGLAIKAQPLINDNNIGLPFTIKSNKVILEDLFIPKVSKDEQIISWIQFLTNFITRFIRKIYVINNSRKYFYNFKINYLEPKNPNLQF